MKSAFWVVIGIACGAALGIILPMGMTYSVMLISGDDAGIGTVFSLLTPFSILIGIIAGAGVGRHRACTGSWSGVFDGPSNQRSNAEHSFTLAQDFSAIEKRATGLSERDAQEDRERYLQSLVDEYESTKLNYISLGVWLPICLLIPILIVFPIYSCWEHYQLKRAMNRHIKKMTEVTRQHSQLDQLNTSPS